MIAFRECLPAQLLVKFFGGMRMSIGNATVAIRSKRRLRGNREQVRLHGYGFMLVAAEKNSENLCPLPLEQNFQASEAFYASHRAIGNSEHRA